MENTIKIKNRYLVFRHEARKILKNILEIGGEQKSPKNVYLDFSEVIFISRGFSDELLNAVDYLKSQKIFVGIINLRSQLQKFINQVKQTKEKIRKEQGQARS